MAKPKSFNTADELGVRLLMLNTGADREEALKLWAGSALYDALCQLATWTGPVHVPRCSGDDTCECPGRAVNDKVNAAVAKAEGR